jgi:hypothetical protein
MGVSPTMIHKSKDDHKVAVFKLANGITSSLGYDNSGYEPRSNLERREAYNELKRNAESVILDGEKRAKVELTEEILESLGPDPKHLLERMDGNSIETEDQEYKPGSVVHFKV